MSRLDTSTSSYTLLANNVSSQSTGKHALMHNSGGFRGGGHLAPQKLSKYPSGQKKKKDKQLISLNYQHFGN